MIATVWERNCIPIGNNMTYVQASLRKYLYRYWECRFVWNNDNMYAYGQRLWWWWNRWWQQFHWSQCEELSWRSKQQQQQQRKGGCGIGTSTINNNKRVVVALVHQQQQRKQLYFVHINYVVDINVRSTILLWTVLSWERTMKRKNKRYNCTHYKYNCFIHGLRS